MIASAHDAEAVDDLHAWKGRIGMACLIAAETSFFGVFIVAYLF